MIDVLLIGAASAVVLTLSACSGDEVEADDFETNLSALISTVEGFHFYPPLAAAAPTYSGSFDDTALSVLTVELEELDGHVARTVATFDQHSNPRLRLVASHQAYFVNVPAAAYLTARDRTYRFRVRGAGRELGFADLSGAVWSLLDRQPGLTIGVRVRVEIAACATVVPDSVEDGCDGADNDCDGVTDEDCRAGGAQSFVFTDTMADDLGSTPLYDFFAGLSVSESDFLSFSIRRHDGTTIAWCSERADWYVQRYLEMAPGSNYVESGTWSRWYRNGGAVWNGPINQAHYNYFGRVCDGLTYSWCGEWGMGGLQTCILPSRSDEVGESYALDFSNGRGWEVEIRVGSTFAAACE